jgi:hypothetical protein
MKLVMQHRAFPAVAEVQLGVVVRENTRIIFKTPHMTYYQGSSAMLSLMPLKALLIPTSQSHCSRFLHPLPRSAFFSSCYDFCSGMV